MTAQSPVATHHVLHADADLSVAVEGPVESHDVGRVALVQNLQLADDLVPDGRFDLQVDQLGGGYNNYLHKQQQRRQRNVENIDIYNVENTSAFLNT